VDGGERCRGDCGVTGAPPPFDGLPPTPSAGSPRASGSCCVMQGLCSQQQLGNVPFLACLLQASG
jgi:hypothetical protein